ncbi:PREDICTED: uncharacterized protein LOC107329617 [Acropora digitifera]|uniref:uncharacterized protein LOC107329617 n=1 Tax=Acropora digitifera TaxID=70779 RepID=UPI00077A1E31|nr:PREDICTED: uncharacterized protein LOC107329617 [Acropora digitifera]
MDIFDDYCVVYERLKTVPQIRIVPLDKVEDQYVVQLPKDVCVLEAGSNQMFNLSKVRVSVSSPILPARVLEYNMESKSTVEKCTFTQKSSFDSSEFCCTRHEVHSKATADKVPQNKNQDYCSSENRYAAEVLADTKSFQEQLTNEMSEWIEKHCDDESVPEELDGFVYYISNPPENSFLPVYCRRRILEGVREKLSYSS